MNELALKITRWRESKGFYTPASITGPDGDAMLGKLMLVVTEVAEAAEAVRHGDMENFQEEIADTFIRLLDICGAMGIDINKVIENKMAINQQRPVRHGKKTSL